jgi:uncharacterized protein (DUF2267 family)
MSAVGLESIDHTVQLTHQWINDLNNQLKWNNKARAYRLLRVVLHGIRDWVQVDEAADFAAQLPTLLRGVYYEQWRPATTPVKPRDKAAFLARVDEAFRNDPFDYTAGTITEAFKFLSSKVSVGEIEEIRKSFPTDLRQLWPAP